MMGLRKSAVQQFKELLEDQQRALLSGDLEALAPMARDLEKALERLRRDKGTSAEISKIKDAAARNARLLLAAQAGVSSAHASLTSSRAPSLTTYGADGQSQAATVAASRTIGRR